MYGPLDLDLTIDNPMFRSRDVPYRIDGTAAGLIERRTATEVMATLRYDR